MIADLVVADVNPAMQDRYVGSSFNPESGTPYVIEGDRTDYLDQTPGSAVYSERPGVPNALDLQSDGVGATSDVGGWLGMPQAVWYDSERPNAGYPLPVPSEFAGASEFTSANDQAAIYANDDFGIDDYARFGQPQLVSDGHRITERTLDVPVPWKAEPTFPAQIQKVRPWDKVMGAWPWSGTKAGLSQPVVSTPNYFPNPIPDGVVSPGGNGPTVPNTPSLWPQPMTWRVIPEQWDNNYVVSGV